MTQCHALRRCRSLPMSVNWEGISFQGTAQPRTAHGEVQFPLQHQLPAETRSRRRPRQTAVVCSCLPRHVAKHHGPASTRPVMAHPKEAAAAQSLPNLPPLQNHPVPDQHAALFTADSNNQDVLKLLLCCKVSLNWLLHPNLLANFLLCHQRPYLIQQECALVQARVVTDPRPTCVP